MVANHEQLFSDIRNVILSNDYSEISKNTIKSTGKTLCDDMFDAEIEYCVKLIEASKIPVSEIQALVRNKEDAFIEYCKYYIFAAEKLELGQEYNPKEIPVVDEPSNEATIGYSKTYLFQYGVFFIMLMNKIDELTDFLKKIRKPHASKFAKSLNSFFLSLNKK